MKVFGIIVLLSLIVNVWRGYERIHLKRTLHDMNEIYNDYSEKNLFARTFSSMASGLRVQETPKRFSLTEEGRMLIDEARRQHTAPALLPAEKFTEGLCAGYLYELTALMWGPTAPITVGMMHPITKVAADARELPYGYRYKGGTIAHEIDPDVGRQLKNDPKQYPSLVSTERMKEFFVQAFDPKSYFGDIGFLYAQTRMTQMLGTFDNYNSHIGKNFGRSVFVRTVATPAPTTQATLKTVLSCGDAMRPLVVSLLTHYERTINTVPVALVQTGADYQFVERTSGREIQIASLDTIAYEDIAVVHFFNGPHVDSLLQIACQGEFYPINVLQLHPDFLETK